MRVSGGAAPLAQVRTPQPRLADPQGPQGARSGAAVSSRQQVPGVPTETLESSAAFGVPAPSATGIAWKTAPKAPGATASRSNPAAASSLTNASGITLACHILKVTADADFSDTPVTGKDKKQQLLTFESAKAQLMAFESMCSSPSAWAELVHDTHTLTHVYDRGPVSVIESFEMMHALMKFPESERHAVAEQVKPLLKKLVSFDFAPTLVLLHKKVGPQYRSDYVAMMAGLIAQEKVPSGKRAEEPKSFADCLSRAEATAANPITGNSLFSYLQRLAAIPDESRHYFAETSSVVREFCTARRVPLPLLHCLHANVDLAPLWPHAAERLAQNLPQAPLYSLDSGRHDTKVTADINVVHTYQIILFRAENRDVLPLYTKNPPSPVATDMSSPVEVRQQTVTQAATPTLVHKSVRSEDTMGVSEACAILKITKKSNFTRFKGAGSDKKTPLLTLKGAKDYLLGFQGMCSKADVWDAAVHYTEALTHVYPRTEVSPIESLTLMHALLQFPESEQDVVAQIVRPLLTVLAPEDFAPVLSLLHKKVGTEHRTAFIETMLRFAIAEKMPADTQYKPPKNFADCLSRESQAADGEIKGFSKFSSLQRLAAIADKDRPFVSQTCDVLQPLFGDRKLSLGVLDVLHRTPAVPSRWAQ
ncbi:MAG: hypothetical protein EOO38_10460, partial [Cytophagaceae bacterium]